MSKFGQELPNLQTAIKQIRNNPESVNKLVQTMEAEIDRRQERKDSRA